MKKNNENLSDFENFVLWNKGTEKPFSGEYNNNFEKGIYVCKNCEIPLYSSSSKFESSCGWPSFDDEIPSAVLRTKDADGFRTEITCAYCGAHLGHVFEGEGYTEKNIRHCVNSVSMKFIPENHKPKINRAIFAAGCFWGVEYLFKKLNGVVDTKVGYIGGKSKNPTYEEVCYKNTGHAEAIEIIYNTSKISYDDLVRYFFEIHDFSQLNRQGPDIGDQYRSEIFYTDEEQKQIAEKIMHQLKDNNFKVQTKLSEANEFWIAENYHQNYYENTGSQPYCHYKRDIFKKDFFI